jgi:colicin import membrane protein
MLFSLSGLLGPEREHVERELRAHRRAVQDALLRADRRRLAERMGGAGASSSAGDTEGVRTRAEELRLTLAAEVARQTARAEAAARARVELLEQEREHERRMFELRASGRGGAQLAVAGLVVALFCFLGSLGLYFGKLRPDHQRLQGAYDELVSAERGRAEETKRLLQKSERRRAELAAELDAARKELARRARPAGTPGKR